MSDKGEGEENGFDRLDRKIGMAWSRMCGVLLGILGLFALISGLNGDNLLDNWPLFVAALVLFVLARLCFPSREGMLDLLSDTARRRKWGLMRCWASPRRRCARRWDCGRGCSGRGRPQSKELHWQIP